MGADLASENDPGNHQNSDDANFHIPSPRPAPDDDIAGLPDTQPETGSDDPLWWYDQPRKRGNDVRRYWGQVERIGGPEGDRLREELTAWIRDLLDWAHEDKKKSETGPDAYSGEDGDTDDTGA